jgi:hypothetical protein
MVAVVAENPESRGIPVLFQPKVNVSVPLFASKLPSMSCPTATFVIDGKEPFRLFSTALAFISVHL